MASINNTFLLGNLTKDPDLKYTNEGVAISEMGIAVNRKWRDASGLESSAVDYFNVTAWNSLAENCAANLKKGDRVIIGGHLNLRSWENREGKRYNIINITADIVALSLEFSDSINCTKNEKSGSKRNSSESKLKKSKKIEDANLKSDFKDIVQPDEKTESDKYTI